MFAQPLVITRCSDVIARALTWIAAPKCPRVPLAAEEEMSANRKRRFRPKQVGLSAVLGLFVYWFIWPALVYEPEPDLEYGKRLYKYQKKEAGHTYTPTQQCRFPLLDPFDKSISQFVRHPDPMTCETVHPNFVNARLNTLVQDHELSKSEALTQLEYSLFRRSNVNDSMLVFDPWLKFNGELEMTGSSGCMLRGKYGNNHTYADIFPSVGSTKQKPKVDDNQYRPNVLILGTNSASRSNVIRNLPLSYGYLTEHLGGYDFRGYSKVDESSVPNMVALLTGRRAKKELTLDPQTDFVDSWPFIWKNFSDAGYATMLAEEQPGIFSFNKAMGFKETPTDVYLRPFGQILNDNPGSVSAFCYGNKAESEHFLDAIERFMEVHTSAQIPYFAFSFLWKLSHDDINLVERLDRLLSKWLKRIHGKGLLRDTMVIFMSDHGNRLDPIKSTLVGRYEERMPFLLMRPPEQITKMYQNVQKTLTNNVWRYTCHYDVYETLMDVVSGRIGDQRRPTFNNRGKSLFTPIPDERICDDVDVDQEFCVCQQENSMKPDDPLVWMAANYTVQMINKELKLAKERCLPVRAESIIKADLLGANNQAERGNRAQNESGNVTASVKFVRVTFRAQPNDAIFESSVQVTDQADGVREMRVELSQVGRINSYGQPATCIADHLKHLQKWCTCGELFI